MTMGILEVLIVDACILKDTDLIKSQEFLLTENLTSHCRSFVFTGKMDPYVVIKFGAGQGKTPVWNEKLKFYVEYASNIRDEHPQYQLKIKILDKDTFTKDDFVGELKIYVDDILAQGMMNGKAQILPCNYSIVDPNPSDNGGIRDESEKNKHRFHLYRKNDGEKKSGGKKKTFKHIIIRMVRRGGDESESGSSEEE
ncbi:hypothetical protein MKX01_004655 [Papaver californicum]|nr:hypothetical protein MKX01_004655 [Papaver californicum]